MPSCARRALRFRLSRNFWRRQAQSLALDVELKESGYEPSVVSAVLSSVQTERVVFTSFSGDVVRAVKRAAPTSPAGLLIGRRAAFWQLPTLLSQGFPFARIRECSCDFLALSADLRLTGVIRRAQKRDIPLLIWSVSDREELRRYLHEPSVMGVVTDVLEPI